MSSRTNVLRDRCSFTWKTDIIDHKVREINFRSFNLTLELQPQICQCMVYVLLHDKGKSDVKFNTRTCILDRSGERVFEQVYKGCLRNEQTVWSLERRELLSDGDNFLGEGIVIFDLEIGVYEETVLWDEPATTTKSSGSSKKRNPSCLEIMSLDFDKLYNNEEGSDVVLKCSDREIKAHRHILSARSDVFAAMFRSDMVESQQGVVTIKDVDPETLERMLRYIYCGRVGVLTVEASSELYKAADQYGVETLKDQCVTFLTENLSQTSACDVLLLADTYSHEQLEKSAVDFVVGNSAFLRTYQWNKFCKEHPSVGIKVYRKYAYKQAQCRTSEEKCELEVYQPSSKHFGFSQRTSIVGGETVESTITFSGQRAWFDFGVKSTPVSVFEKSADFTFGTVEKNTEINSIKPAAVEEKGPPSLEKMSLDFSKLFESEAGSDVVLQCGDKQFKAHSYILSVRSNFLATMLRSDMENLKGIVPIEDVVPEILGLVLRYIYTGKVEELTVETASKLYKAADQYVVGPLKNRCASFLNENVSQTSACSILLLADSCNDEQLEKSAMNFILANSSFLLTEQWDNFCKEHLSLGIRVYEKYVFKQA